MVERDREIRVIQRQLDILGGGIDSRSISAENQRKDGSRIVSSSAAKEQYKGGCLEQLEKMVLFDKRVMATHNELVFKRMVTGTKRLLVEKRLASLRGSKGINIDEEGEDIGSFRQSAKRLRQALVHYISRLQREEAQLMMREREMKAEHARCDEALRKAFERVQICTQWIFSGMGHRLFLEWSRRWRIEADNTKRQRCTLFGGINSCIGRQEARRYHDNDLSTDSLVSIKEVDLPNTREAVLGEIRTLLNEQVSTSNTKALPKAPSSLSVLGAIHGVIPSGMTKSPQRIVEEPRSLPSYDIHTHLPSLNGDIKNAFPSRDPPGTNFYRQQEARGVSQKIPFSITSDAGKQLMEGALNERQKPGLSRASTIWASRTGSSPLSVQQYRFS